MEKRNKLIISLSLFALVLLMVGVTYAYFTARIIGAENTSTLSIKAGKMLIEYLENSNIIELSGIYPKTSEWATKTITITGTNTTNINMYYKIGIQIEENSFTEESLTYTLENTLNENGIPIEDTSGRIISGIGTQYLGIGTFTNANSKRHTYILKIYFPETGEDQNDNQRARFRGKIIIGSPQEITPPSLTLDKVTYLAIPFDNTWTYDGVVVEDGVLSYNNSYTNSNKSKTYATSDYIPVNGDFWYTTYDAYTTVATPNGTSTKQGGVYWEASYYNSSYNSTTDKNGKDFDGHANGLTLNEWRNDIYWYADLLTWKNYGRFNSDIMYIKIAYRFHGGYSFGPIKIRNLKVWGQMENNFYLINVNAYDEEGIDIIKYAKGTKNSDYFINNGTIVDNNQIRVEENGIYTVYARDLAGNEVIDNIEITNIV